jgi:hypothetical protein
MEYGYCASIWLTDTIGSHQQESTSMPPISVEQLEALAKELAAMPAYEDRKRIVSKREAISALAGEIAGMRQRGYAIERIVEILRERGIKLSIPTLRSYLREASPQSSSSDAAGKKKPRSRSKTPATA